MPLRTRIFLVVGAFFFLTIAAFFVVQQFQVKNALLIEDQKLEMLIAEELPNVQEITNTFVSQYRAVIDNITQQLSFHFLLMSLVIFFLTTAILWSILKSMMKSLHELSIATEKVSSGKLEEIHISEKAMNRKDEIGILSTSFSGMVEELKNAERVRDVLDKVVNKQVAVKILQEGVKLGGEEKEVTILFSDVRNFTHIAENMEPTEVLDMLNSLLTALSHVIDEYEGVIDKYVGDEIMALFGAPVAMENPTLTALYCAKSMIERIKEWNAERQKNGLITLEIGISVETGKVIAGNVGAENHLSYTILGHHVNLASRLCDAAKDGEILVTENVANHPQVQGKLSFDKLDPISFKGVSSPITIYRLT